MMEFAIKVTGMEGLETAIKQLAYVVAQCATDQTTPVNTQQGMAAQTQQAPTVATSQPAYQQPQQQQPSTQPAYQPAMNPAVPTAPQPPYQQAPPMQQTQQVPAAPVQQSYTQDQMAVAMTGLMDAGKQPVLMQILQSFGTNSLMGIPVEQYPALAAMLRQEGANI